MLRFLFYGLRINLRTNNRPVLWLQAFTKRSKSNKNDSSLFRPVPVRNNLDTVNVGEEFTGDLDKNKLLIILNKFNERDKIHSLLTDNGLDSNQRADVFKNFRRYCLESKPLPSELHILLSDLIQGAGHVDDIFPYYLKFAKEMFPHLECMDDLKKISDLRTPANWYPMARDMKRKIIFHAGPTNSGKTYQALQRFLRSESGVYCGPLKLLASEVYHKSNSAGTPCDLITGEERRLAGGSPAAHISCTVEMASVTQPYDVAVIDEIQMIRDPMRGWAWTRVLLGLMAKEIHLCGEKGAVDLIRKLCETTGEVVEVNEYKRLTRLEVEKRALGQLENVQPGDCIVCFSKNDIYAVSSYLEGLGKEVAIIYGSLPPGAKLAQANKFNDVNSECKFLVATDAIGMGLNLSIRRVIFNSLEKPTMNEDGEKEISRITVSQALQIAGRAGRFGTHWETGYVTCMRAEDMPALRELLIGSKTEPITQAGLMPTAEQIEMYTYHLPNATLSNLMDIFVHLSTVDNSLYFMCQVEDFKYLAETIQPIPLPLKARYVFCCAPINRRMHFAISMFTKFARLYSQNKPVTYEWLCRVICWPLKVPKNMIDLVHLEAVFDTLDLYLWLSYRFPDLFPDERKVRPIQSELDLLIQNGVAELNKLLKNRQQPSYHDHFLQNDTKSFNKKENVSLVGQGKLTERLLSEGLITPRLLDELKKEWAAKNIADNKMKILNVSSTPLSPPRPDKHHSRARTEEKAKAKKLTKKVTKKVSKPKHKK